MALERSLFNTECELLEAFIKNETGEPPYQLKSSKHKRAISTIIYWHGFDPERVRKILKQIETTPFMDLIMEE